MATLYLQNLAATPYRGTLWAPGGAEYGIIDPECGGSLEEATSSGHLHGAFYGDESSGDGTWTLTVNVFLILNNIYNSISFPAKNHFNHDHT